MSHKFPRVVRIAAIFCAFLAGISSAQKKPAVAVLELTGNGSDTAELATLTNRLRTELFETQKFTIVERGEMEAILKEQGFQQTGCTDAACAVQVGQMLNAEYMIVGTVDRIGRVYSVNIRQISVASGAVANNVKSDCADCTIEDVMLKKIRQAARQIAGTDTVHEQEVVTEQRGRKMIKCKKYTGGEAGALMITVIPPDGEVLVDSISYGNGNMVIDYVPVGHHIICIRDKKEFLKKKVAVEYNNTTKCTMDLNTVQHFCLGAGAAIAFPNVSSTDYRKKFVNQNNAGDTMTAPNGSFTWLPIMPTLSFTWRNQKNAGGFILGGMYTNQQVTKTDSLENKFVYKNENVFGEICFIYYRTIIDVEDYFKAELGLMTGVTFYYLGVTPSYGIAQATQQKYLPADHYQINARYYDNGDDSYQHIMWGGPSLAISTGYKSVYLKATYTLLLGAEMPITVTDASPGGTNNTTHKTGKFGFRLDNNLGFSIGYKF